MWTDLSIKDKSDLMRIFLNNGVSSLSDMRRIYDGEQDINNDSYYLGKLKPAIVTPKPVPVRLTYYPVSSAYKISHSELSARNTESDIINNYENHSKILPLKISKKADDFDYNLLTNNCSDETGNFLSECFNTDFTKGITTPRGLQRKVKEYLDNNNIYYTESSNKDSSVNLDFDVPWYNYRLERDKQDEKNLINQKRTLRNINIPEDRKQSIINNSINYILERRHPDYIPKYRIYDGLSNTKSYKDWKEKIKKYKNINIDNDKSYDYIGFYNENPEKAYRLLKENSDTHFTDKYKTPIHETFSDESMYSNNTTKGGHWIIHPNNIEEFQHSDYTMEHPYETNKYLEENNPNAFATYKGGVVLNPAIITADRKRIYDGTKDTNNNYQVSLNEYSKQNNNKFTFEDLNIKPADINYKELALRQRYAESTFNNEAVSPKGAVGAYGIMPQTHKWYVDETGDNGDLRNPEYNKKIRDWLMEKNLKSDIHSTMDTDSVRVGKLLVQYNYGAGNTRKKLRELESKGIDTHNSFEWLDYFPKESVDYVNFTLRNKDVNEHKSEKSYQKAKRKLKIK